MQRDLKSVLGRIMVFGSSLVGGFATASLEALQPGFSFRISVMTFVAFAAGFGLLSLYWKILFHPSRSPAHRRLRRAASVLLALGGIAGFLYPLRFIAHSNVREVAAGLVMALGAVVGVAALLLFCKR